MLSGQRREALVEGEWRGRRRRVVRVVDPEHRQPRPRVVVDRVEVWQKALLLAQRQRQRPCVREEGASLVDGIAGIGVGDGVAGSVRVDYGECEREDRLLAPERRDDLRVRIERRCEAARHPGSDRFAQLRQSNRRRVAHAVAEAVDECLADPRVGRLARVAHAEVDHVDPARFDPPCRFVQPHERIRRLPLEDGGDRHA